MSSLSSRKSWILGAGLFVLVGSSALCLWVQQKHTAVFSILGEESLTSPLLRELYETEIFQRLRKVDQSGPSRYFNKVGVFSRFSHSLGVMALLKRHNCSLAEQAAGLMHDVSHTAFSHLGDYLFMSDINTAVEKATYQDDILLDYLKKHHIDELVQRHNLKLEDLDPDSGRYLALEQPLPNLCADRIEYILHTGIITNKITNDEMQEILADLHFDGSYWYFTKPDLAKKLAELSLYFIKELWGPAWNIRINAHFAKVIKRCFVLGVLKYDDLFLTDEDILEKIKAYQDKHNDPLIKLYWEQCERIDEDLPGVQYKSVKIRPKFRGVDPFVKTSDGSLVYLTTIDSDYMEEFIATKEWCLEGFEIKIIVPPKVGE